MTEEDRERLKRIFGSDISAWPAPFRQEARLFLSEIGEDWGTFEDVQLDRLILKAAQMETDDETLTRKVRERIDHEHRTFFRFFGNLSSMRLPAVAASFAVILVAVGVAGYTVAGVSYSGMEDALLALATGDPAASGIRGLKDEGLL